MAALRLPMQSATPLETLITTSVNDAPTAASLKLVKTVVKNLVDHPGEEKYTSIKLSGKAGQKLAAAPTAIRYLESLGFVADGDAFAISAEAALTAGSAAPTAAGNLVAANSTLSQLAVPSASAAAPRPALATTTSASNGSASNGSASVDQFAGMSLKQKARRQKELDDAKKREDAKRLKAQELAKIKQDAYVRKNDENWKAAAAGVKGGKDIDTFRGKHGEDGGS